MDGLTALFASLVVSLRAAVNLDACPGDWSWAVSALGVFVGLLPTVGLVAVAMRQNLPELPGFRCFVREFFV